MIQMCIGSELTLEQLDEKGGGLYLCDLATVEFGNPDHSWVKKGTKLVVGDILKLQGLGPKYAKELEYLTSHDSPNGDSFHRPGGGKPLGWKAVAHAVSLSSSVILLAKDGHEKVKGAHRSYTDILDDYYDNNVHNDERSQRSDIAYWNGNIDSSAYNRGYFSDPA
eukprot:98282_1